MISFSRRQLARYAVDEMLAKRPSTSLANHLAAALIASGRRNEADLLLSDIDQELEDRGLVVNARVSSAHPLSASLKKELSLRLKQLSAVKDVSMMEQIDKDLIGGVRIETASRTIDMTLKQTLRELKEAN